jgi:hypothetical protein
MKVFADENLVDYLDSMPKGRQFTRADFDRAIGAFRGDAMASEGTPITGRVKFGTTVPTEVTGPSALLAARKPGPARSMLGRARERAPACAATPFLDGRRLACT